MNSTETCKKCGEEILRIKTATSRRRTPVDLEPVWIQKSTDGDAFFRMDGSCVFGFKIGDAMDDPIPVIAEVYESHLATCTGGAKKNRKPRTRPSGYR